MQLKHNVLIIGAGNIGALYDRPEMDEILTHAHAFTKHEGFRLLGFVDIYKTKAQKAASVWGGKAFLSIEEAFGKERADVVCVAVPDDLHYTTLKALAKLPVRVIFTEKPLTKTLEEAAEIVQIFSGDQISVGVDYFRRFIPEFEQIKTDIDAGVYGRYLTGTGYYGKGLIHNGSHLIDLLRFLIGEIESTKYVDSVSDYYPDDESVAAVLTLENNKPFFLQHADCNSYTMFEIDVLFELKRIRICDLGLRVEEYSVQESKIYKGYKNIVKTNEIATSFGSALYNAADNIYQHLENGKRLKCSAEDAYKTLHTCMRIKESVEHA